MSLLMDDEIKRWTARRKSALVLEIIQGKTTVAEASRAHDLPPSDADARSLASAFDFGQPARPPAFVSVRPETPPKRGASPAVIYLGYGVALIVPILLTVWGFASGRAAPGARSPRGLPN